MAEHNYKTALAALVTKLGGISGVALATSDPMTSQQIPDNKFPALVVYEGPEADHHTATSQTDYTRTLAVRLMYRVSGSTTEDSARDIIEALHDALNADPQLLNGGATANCVHCLSRGSDPPITWHEQQGVSFRDVGIDLRYRRDN